jgi:hypothetical protein
MGSGVHVGVIDGVSGLAQVILALAAFDRWVLQPRGLDWPWPWRPLVPPARTGYGEGGPGDEKATEDPEAFSSPPAR